MAFLHFLFHFFAPFGIATLAAFQLIFCDSFDHYATGDILKKYGANSPDGSVGTTNPRTGTQACALVSLGGPTTKNFGMQPNLVVGHALNPGVYEGAIMIFEQQSATNFACFAQINPDSSISIINHTPTQPGPVLLTTPPNVVQIGVYAYIEYGITFSETGNVYVRVNENLVASAIGVPTIPTPTPGNTWCDAVSLSGPSAILGSAHYHDDFYVGYDDVGAPQNSFIGAVRIYPYIPSANKTPLNWTPNANTNYQQVQTIPPSASAYVQDDTIGDIDQYEMQPIPGHGPLGQFTIVGGQTVMCAALSAAGSGEIAPNIGGSNPGTNVSLSTSFDMYTQPYLINPVTGVAFVPADFTGTTTMGPEVTG